MKILVLHNLYRAPSGEERVMADEVACLRAGGHTVTVETVSNAAISGPRATLRAFLDAPHAAGRARWAVRRARETGAEIVHVHNFFPLLSPAIHPALADRGFAVVQTLHNYRLLCAQGMFTRAGAPCAKCLGPARGWALVHRCYRGSLPGTLAAVRMQRASAGNRSWHEAVHRFVVSSAFVGGQFAAAGFSPERIAVKPITAPAGASPPFTERAGALFVGRLAAEKGIDTLLAAWRALDGVPLTIIGDGPERARLERLAPPAIRVVGPLSAAQTGAAMEQALCLVVPSVGLETGPLVVAEAFGRGLPVVASRLGSLLDVVSEGVDGFLVPPGDPTALAARVRAVVADPARWAAMSAAARASHARRHAPHTALPALERIYADAISTASALSPAAR